MAGLVYCGPWRSGQIRRWQGRDVEKGEKGEKSWEMRSGAKIG